MRVKSTLKSVGFDHNFKSLFYQDLLHLGYTTYTFSWLLPNALIVYVHFMHVWTANVW